MRPLKSRRMRLLWLSLLTVVCLGAVYLQWSLSGEEQIRTREDRRVFGFGSSSEVSSFRLKYGGKEMAFEIRRGGAGDLADWWLTEPVSARADGVVVEGFLTRLSSLMRIDLSTQGLPSESLSLYGLEKRVKNPSASSRTKLTRPPPSFNSTRVTLPSLKFITRRS